MSLPKVVYRFPKDGSAIVREENGETVVEVQPFFHTPRSIASLCTVQVLDSGGRVLTTQSDSLFGATGKRKTRERTASAIPRFAADEIDQPKSERKPHGQAQETTGKQAGQ